IEIRARMMLVQQTWLFVLLTLSFVPSNTEDVIINTKYGKVLGLAQTLASAQGPARKINKFLGIPYAQQPIGDLRFKPPQPLKPWKEKIYNATSFGNICVQSKLYFEFLKSSIRRTWPDFSKKNMREDCLNLNIYTPAWPDISDSVQTRKAYPVLFYIHGGSYYLGTPNRVKTPGEIAPQYGIVLVTIHYRLGVLGFLTTGDVEAPGNAGMLDQIQALRWVKENIAGFGGDPNQITLVGNSAGASSVGLHLLSPLTKGLFQKAIMESGTELSPFAVNPLKTAIAKSKNVAKNLLCDTEDHVRMVKCLQTKDAEDLAFYYDPFPAPHVDNYFLLDTPRSLRKEGKFQPLPLMLGFTKHDGFHMISDLELPDQLTPSYFRKGIERALQKFMKIHDPMTAVRLADAIEFTYQPWAKTTDPDELYKALVALCTDIFIVAPTMESANFHSEYSATYLFEYSHISNNSRLKWATHSSNADYTFGAPIHNATHIAYTKEDRNVSHLLLQLYSNFLKFG
ncbi:predicted protein, partial [Nematostella vectensis]